VDVRFSNMERERSEVGEIRDEWNGMRRPGYSSVQAHAFRDERREEAAGVVKEHNTWMGGRS
jgi:hypothetical protein